MMGFDDYGKKQIEGFDLILGFFSALLPRLESFLVLEL